jgi:N-carbamoyl-L-amino-acid hydrolase
VVAAVLGAPHLRAQTSRRHVNETRLWGTLEKLSEFGRPRGAGFEGGVTRLGFSEEDLAARDYIISLMRDAHLTVRIDAAGNIFGRRSGTESLPVLLFGSHIDSVPNGGNFDGDVGSLGAIEVMRALEEQNVKTRHPLEAVIWTNEEGHHFGRGLFGSGAAAGLIERSVLDRRDESGKSINEWLRRYGQDPARFEDARIKPGSVAAYVELHIEQGGRLDAAHTQIGVVEGIVGINWHTCVASGFSNHSGTTPMDGRADALAAASRAVIAVREEIRAEAGRQVGTVGYLKVEPGARNIIPGRVEFPVELRDLDAARIERFWTRIAQRFDAIAREEHVKIECTPLQMDQPALTDPRIKDTVREAAREAGYTTMDLPSGAGHDAQQISRIAPMGMIFVPSRDGISHSPREYSSPSAIADGADVLYRTVILLDSRLDSAKP